MMYYCGIDVAKRKHAVVVLDERGKVYRPVFTIQNTQAGAGCVRACATHPYMRVCTPGTQPTTFDSIRV